MCGRIHEISIFVSSKSYLIYTTVKFRLHDNAVNGEILPQSS